MKLRVEASFVDEQTGQPIFGYLREKVVIFDDETDSPQEIGTTLLDWLDEAKADVGKQTAAAQRNFDETEGRR